MTAGLVKNLSLPDGVGQTLARVLEPYSDPRYAGHALSAGIVIELYLATKLHNLPHDTLLQAFYEIRENYPPVNVSCDDYGKLLAELHGHTQKFRLLFADHCLSEAEAVSDALILEAMDFYRESYGC